MQKGLQSRTEALYAQSDENFSDQLTESYIVIQLLCITYSFAVFALRLEAVVLSTVQVIIDLYYYY